MLHFCLPFDETEDYDRNENLDQTVVRFASYLRNKVSDPIKSFEAKIMDNSLQID
jgi:hypothetical protein